MTCYSGYWTVQEMQRDTEVYRDSKWQEVAIPVGLGEQREDKQNKTNKQNNSERDHTHAPPHQRRRRERGRESMSI